MTSTVESRLPKASAKACPARLCSHQESPTRLCSRFAGVQLDRDGRVDWIDLTQHPERLAAAGLTREQAVALIHAMDHRRDGEILVGVPAFLAVWEQLPYWSILPPVLRAVPFALPAISIGYHAWARHRLAISGRLRALGQGSACAMDDATCKPKSSK